LKGRDVGVGHAGNMTNPSLFREMGLGEFAT